MREQELQQRKQQIFDALQQLKQKEYEKLSSFQEEQLESINDSQDLQTHDIIENSNENQMREVRLESNAIDRLAEELEVLQSFDPHPIHDEVSLGSIVHTDKFRLAVLIPQLNFEVQGQRYTAISPKSPLYQALAGHKAGDSIEFQNKTHHIKEVF